MMAVWYLNHLVEDQEIDAAHAEHSRAYAEFERQRDSVNFKHAWINTYPAVRAANERIGQRGDALGLRYRARAS